MTGETVENLPEAVKKIQKKLEDSAFVPVQWIEDPELKGGAKATWGEDGETPTVHFRNFSHSLAAEELLHLRLDQIGYPRLGRPGANWAVNGAATLLHNLLQHQIIFPQIVNIGFTPGIGECETVSSIIDSRMGKTADDVKRCKPHQLVAVSTMIYICSRMYCPLDKHDYFDQKMEVIPEVAEARMLGDRLIPFFDLDENSSEKTYRRLLKLLVDELQLTDDVDLMG